MDDLQEEVFPGDANHTYGGRQEIGAIGTSSRRIVAGDGARCVI
jgi:hypothetical protein